MEITLHATNAVTNESFTVSLSPDSTVGDLRSRLAEASSIDVGELHLCSCGKELTVDDASLADCRLRDGSPLYTYRSKCSIAPTKGMVDVEHAVSNRGITLVCGKALGRHGGGGVYDLDTGTGQHETVAAGYQNATVGIGLGGYGFIVCGEMGGCIGGGGLYRLDKIGSGGGCERVGESNWGQTTVMAALESTQSIFLVDGQMHGCQGGGSLYKIKCDVPDLGRANYALVGQPKAWGNATVMAASGNSVYIVCGVMGGCCGGGGLYRIDLATEEHTQVGDADWRNATGMVAIDGKLYIVCGLGDGGLYRIDPTSGTFEEVDVNATWGDAIGMVAHAGELCFVCGGGGAVHCVDTKTGAGRVVPGTENDWGNTTVMFSHGAHTMQIRDNAKRVFELASGASQDDLETLSSDVDAVFEMCVDIRSLEVSGLLCNLVSLRPALASNSELCEKWFTSLLAYGHENAMLDVVKKHAFCCDNVQSLILNKITELTQSTEPLTYREETMLVYLATALTKTRKGTQLYGLEEAKKLAITNSCRRLIEDPDLQAKQKALVWSSATPPAEAKFFQPLGSRPSKYMLEVLLFVPLVHLARDDPLKGRKGVPEARSLLPSFLTSISFLRSISFHPFPFPLPSIHFFPSFSSSPSFLPPFLWPETCSRQRSWRTCRARSQPRSRKHVRVFFKEGRKEGREGVCQGRKEERKEERREGRRTIKEGTMEGRKEIH
jgi:hypothetical protein